MCGNYIAMRQKSHIFAGRNDIKENFLPLCHTCHIIMDTHLKAKLYKALTSSRIEHSEIFLKSIYERVHMSLSNPESGERNRFFLVIA